MNKIDDALKALPSDLTWAQAMDVVGEAVLPIWKISGKVAADDQLSDVDRRRLADAIVKRQTSTKEEITMTSTNEAATMLADAEQRQFLLAAAKHRRQLQKNDMELIFDIAARLRVQVADARAADAAQRRPKATTAFDASAHRPGWRDARRKNVQEEGEEEDETLNDCELARREHDAYITNAYKQGR